MSVYDKMELCFRAGDGLAELCLDEDWQVRYAAAVAIGESGEEKWLSMLEKMLEIEDKRPLYTQPSVDDANATRLAERIGPLKDVFENSPYTQEEKEAWQCRGRVKTAAAEAVKKIGKMTPGIREKLCTYLTVDGNDYSVRAAAAGALGRAGDESVIPALEVAAGYDEWCAKTEAVKALARLRERGRSNGKD